MLRQLQGEGETWWDTREAIRTAVDIGWKTAGPDVGISQVSEPRRSQRAVLLACPVMRELVGAVSVGLQDGDALLDLCYEEDSNAIVDLNVVMAESGRFIELQGTAEKQPFSHDELARMVDCARAGMERIFAVQRQTLELESA